jgi:hypothetical protein
MSLIRFETKLFKIRDWTVLQLPEKASAKLPSRGMVLVEGTINGQPLKTALEPDGKGSHWFKVEPELQQEIGAKAGDTVTLEIGLAKEWWRPEVPADLAKALAKAPKAKALWNDITPKAQWEWVRWIRGAKQSETYQKHIEVAISKLNSGMRRPCCFNSSMCSEPYVASSKWALLEPA